MISRRAWVSEQRSEDRSADLDWLKRAAKSIAFGPMTESLLMPYVREIESLRAKVESMEMDSAEHRWRSE